MISLRTLVASLGVLSLAACSAPPMSASEARTALREFRDHADTVCARDGLPAFRRAVRAYAKAQRAEGELWPSVAALSGDSDAEAPDLELLVLGAMSFGLISPNDLGGDAPRIKRLLAAGMPAGFSLKDIDINGHPACGEVLSAFEDVTRTQLQAARIDLQMQRALRDGKSRRIEQLSQRRARLMRQHHNRLADLREALERVRS
jgi:hypothetical protein